MLTSHDTALLHHAYDEDTNKTALPAFIFHFTLCHVHHTVHLMMDSQTVDGMLTVPDPNNVFLQARNDFISLLSPSEQADLSQCSSVQELIGNLEKFQHLNKGGRRIKRCLEKVKHLGDNLEPFFSVMEIFCGAHPEWANIALGSLQLVLQVRHIYPIVYFTALTNKMDEMQLASHFVTFFEKLCEVVETLNTRLPRFQELYDSIVKQSTQTLSPALKFSFQRLYCHLFEFYGAVARVFSKKCGSMYQHPT